MMNKKRSTIVLVVIGVFLLISVFCLVPLLFRIYDNNSLWPNFYGALMGVILTAVTTVVLLLGQTSSEEEKERNTKVFEEKISVYKEFLKMFCKIVEDGKIDETNKIQLQFQLSYIAMHTKSVHIRQISEQVKNIVLKINADRIENYMPQLFTIVQSFREELYGDKSKLSVEDKQNIDSAISNFSTIMLTKEEKEEYLKYNKC
ncbi:MAG: hypothetical protein IJ213_00405 [Bacteroidales bacterium]|nr:hypothetical protein [Bacteroidales bacterium]